MPPSTYRSVAYFTNWCVYARKYRPQDLPVEYLTHILYAFANVSGTGEVVLTDSYSDLEMHWETDSWNDIGHNMYGCLKQLNLHKLANRNLKVLLSIGGWTFSSNFAVPASTPEGRVLFAKSAVNHVKQLGFDGLDIDWEYPKSREEAQNFVLLLAECRRELDEYGSSLTPPAHFELTVACPASAQNFGNMEVAAMDRLLDFWNLMAYDYAGSWDSLAGHHAALHKSIERPHTTPFNTVDALNMYLGENIDPRKIVMGIPLYGRAFLGADEPGKPYNGVPEGSWEPGTYDYKALPLPGTKVTVDTQVGGAICCGPYRTTSSNQVVLVTYDNCASAKIKAKFIHDWGLGGAMWWESSGDRSGPESLIKVVVDELGGPAALEKKPNCVTFPATQYDNLRNNFCK